MFGTQLTWAGSKFAFIWFGIAAVSLFLMGALLPGAKISDRILAMLFLPLVSVVLAFGVGYGSQHLINQGKRGGAIALVVILSVVYGGGTIASLGGLFGEIGLLVAGSK